MSQVQFAIRLIVTTLLYDAFGLFTATARPYIRLTGYLIYSDAWKR